MNVSIGLRIIGHAPSIFSWMLIVACRLAVGLWPVTIRYRVWLVSGYKPVFVLCVLEGKFLTRKIKTTSNHMKDKNSKKTRKNWMEKGKIRRKHDNFENAHCMFVFRVRHQLIYCKIPCRLVILSLVHCIRLRRV